MRWALEQDMPLLDPSVSPPMKQCNDNDSSFLNMLLLRCIDGSRDVSAHVSRSCVHLLVVTMMTMMIARSGSVSEEERRIDRNRIMED